MVCLAKKGEKSLASMPRKLMDSKFTDQDGDIYDERELFNEYARFGGMPMLADVGLEMSLAFISGKLIDSKFISNI